MRIGAQVGAATLLLLCCFATQSAKASSDEAVTRVRVRHLHHLDGLGYSSGGQECAAPGAGCTLYGQHP